MESKNRILVMIFSGFLMACSNENPETLMDNTPVQGVVTYKQNVKSIIDNNCISCHGATPTNGASFSLVTYTQVKNAMQNRGLLNRISLNNGNSLLMPQGGPRMPQATIDVVAKWQQDGLLEE
ncbi:c-type cytochrome [Flavobacterium flavipallidum]|uniref:Cytochrome c n=1 Tax=Flavobacterium flavipallidum TaxID=3139140 RepID=A0ABU9HIH8_9FLAO